MMEYGFDFTDAFGNVAINRQELTLIVRSYGIRSIQHIIRIE